MLPIHRLFLKTALVYLFLGALAGGWMLLAQSGVLLEGPRSLYTIHIHLLGIGFFLMMVCGVALWMFPRKSGESREQASRDPLAWTTYILLTAGLALRCIALLLRSGSSDVVLAVSVFLQLGGVLAFILAIWPRIYLPGAKTKASAASNK